jgi:formylmethanofuran--tetrahydromethanopterin N-formyltransferase
MSRIEAKSKSTGSENELKVIGEDKDTGDLTVKHHPTGNILTIVNSFAEMFPMWVGRIMITAEDEHWALTAAKAATGFATSIIMSPAEAGIENILAPDSTLDGRSGVVIQIFHRTRRELKNQMILRVGQCVMTCPTTAAFDALPDTKRRLKVGRSLRLFGDGFQKKDVVFGRVVWRIPVMEGEFLVEDCFGAAKAIAGGNLLILAKNQKVGLKAAEEAANAIIHNNDGVILPFPGGVCRSGSKAGSIKYKLPASTNHQFCPRLNKIVSESYVPDNVSSVYEIVINGLNLEVIKKAMSIGMRAAAKISGVVKISSANFGGRLGPYKINLRDLFEPQKQTFKE